jgi:hypothetical protein
LTQTQRSSREASTSTSIPRRGVHGKELLADIPNYTDIPPTIQISEIVA